MGDIEEFDNRELAWEKSVSMLWEFHERSEHAVLSSLLETLVGGNIPNLLSQPSNYKIDFNAPDALHALLHPKLFSKLGTPTTMPSGLVKVDLGVHLRVLEWLERHLRGPRNLEVARRAKAGTLLLRLLTSLEKDEWPDAKAWEVQGGGMGRNAYQKKVAQLLGRCVVEILTHHTSFSDLSLLLQLLGSSCSSSWLQPLLAKLLTAPAQLISSTSSLYPLASTQPMQLPQAWFDVPSTGHLSISAPIQSATQGLTFAVWIRLEHLPGDKDLQAPPPGLIPRTGHGAAGTLEGGTRPMSGVRANRTSHSRSRSWGNEERGREALLFSLQATSVEGRGCGVLEGRVTAEGGLVLRSFEHGEGASGKVEAEECSPSGDHPFGGKMTKLSSAHTGRDARLRAQEWCCLVVTFEAEHQTSGRLRVFADEQMLCQSPFKLPIAFASQSHLLCQMAGGRNSPSSSPKLMLDAASMLDMQVGPLALFSSSASVVEVLETFAELSTLKPSAHVCRGSCGIKPDSQEHMGLERGGRWDVSTPDHLAPPGERVALLVDPKDACNHCSCFPSSPVSQTQVIVWGTMLGCSAVQVRSLPQTLCRLGGMKALQPLFPNFQNISQHDSESIRLHYPESSSEHIESQIEKSSRASDSSSHLESAQVSPNLIPCPNSPTLHHSSMNLNPLSSLQTSEFQRVIHQSQCSTSSPSYTWDPATKSATVSSKTLPAEVGLGPDACKRIVQSLPFLIVPKYAADNLHEQTECGSFEMAALDLENPFFLKPLQDPQPMLFQRKQYGAYR